MSALRHLLAPPEIPQPTGGRLVLKVGMLASRSARYSNAPVDRKEDYLRVQAELMKAGPATCTQISEAIDLAPKRIYAALHKLRADGLAVYEKARGDFGAWRAVEAEECAA